MDGRLRAPLLLASLLTLVWPGVYPALLWLIARSRPRMKLPEPVAAALPSLTVVLPTYQERETIEARLADLDRCFYPRDRFEVIVVDSGSSDGCADLAETFAKSCKSTRIRVIRERERAGKSAAITLALHHVTSELVAVTDATTAFEPDCLQYVAADFADPTVGAATGYFEVTGQDRPMENEEKSFWRVRNLLRGLEAEVDSTPFLSGELCCFRRSLVESLDADSLADDMNVALKVRRQGYRVIVDPRSRFSEPRSAAFEELTQTKSRRAAGGIQELLRHRDLLFNKRYGLFGMLIMPSAYVFYLPLRLPALLVVGLQAKRGLGALPWLLRLPAVAAAAYASVKLAPALKPKAGMLLFNEWMFLMGWRRVLMNGMDVRWSQERSTREAQAATAAKDVP